MTDLSNRSHRNNLEISEAPNDASSSVHIQEPRAHLINDENFILLKSYQEKIFKATEVTPSIRKILNHLINTENLEKVSSAIIKSLLS